MLPSTSRSKHGRWKKVGANPRACATTDQPIRHRRRKNVRACSRACATTNPPIRRGTGMEDGANSRACRVPPLLARHPRNARSRPFLPATSPTSTPFPLLCFGSRRSIFWLPLSCLNCILQTPWPGAASVFLVSLASLVARHGRLQGR